MRIAYVAATVPPSRAAAGRSAAPVAYEAHAVPRRRAQRLAEAWLFRCPRFSLFAAISRALAEDCATPILAHLPPPSGTAAA